MLGMKTLGWSLLLTGFALLFPNAAQSSCPSGNSFFDMALPSNIDFGTWESSGTIATETTFCVASADTRSNNPRPSDSVCPYQISVEDFNGGAGFLLYLNGNTAAAADERLLAEISHKDIYQGDIYELLQHNVQETQTHDGMFKGCEGSPDNSYLKVQIDASEFTNVQPGSYSGTFQVNGLGGVGLATADSEVFSVAVTVASNDPNVQISRIDNIVLGSFNGTADMTADEAFCAYTESGGYRLTITAPNQDVSGNFFLAGDNGDLLPFQVEFSQSVTSPAFVTVGSSSIIGLTGSTLLDCGNADNAVFRVSASEQDLRAASSGNYVETITILMEPE